MIRVRLDGQSIPPDDVSGWQEITSTVKRNVTEIRGISVVTDAELTFHGETFNRLYRLLHTEGYCGQLRISLEQVSGSSTREIFRGLINLSDMKFDMTQRSATVKVRDDNLFSRINNNKSIEFDLLAQHTKNGLPVAAVPIYRMSRIAVTDPPPPFPPATPTLFEYPVMRVYDVLQYLVACMSDNEVGFHSDFLLDESEDGLGHLFLTPGIVLRMKQFPYRPVGLSFITLISELKKLRNIDFSIEHQPQGPVLRMEHVSYWLRDENMFRLDNVHQVIIEQDVSSLVSHLEVGVNRFYQDGAYDELGQLLDTWMLRNFYLSGQCNIDERMDLEGRFLRSSNIIEAVVEDGSTSFDSNYFFICCKDIDSAAKQCRAMQDATVPRIYNRLLMNRHIIRSYFHGMPGDVVYEQTAQDDGFRVAVTTGQDVLVHNTGETKLQPVMFESILSGQFDLLQSAFRAPVDGRYRFRVRILWRNINAGIRHGVRVILIRHYDSHGLSGTVLNELPSYKTEHSIDYSPMPVSGADEMEAELTLAKDDMVMVFYGLLLQVATVLPGQLRIRADSSFQSVYVARPGVEQFRAKDHLVIQYRLDGGLTYEQFRRIVDNPAGRIVVTSHDRAYSGWIDSVRYNHLTSQAEITLRSSISNATVSDT